MRKIWLFCLLTTILLFLLAGCSCEHQWQDATCTAPKTCTLCQETEGQPLTHSFSAAICEVPETCKYCGITQGEAPDHSWLDATCTTGKECSVCHEFRGKPLGHDWEDPTTELPKICKRCNQRSGSKLVIDPRFSTPNVEHLLGKWQCETVLPGLEGYIDEIPCTLFLEFTGTGDIISSVELHDQIAYMEAVAAFYEDMIYAMLESEGYTRSEADAIFQENTGVSISQYIAAETAGVDLSLLFDYLYVYGVYYANEDGLYVGDNWKSDFTLYDYTYEEDTMQLDVFAWKEDMEIPVWTRMEEA